MRIPLPFVHRWASMKWGLVEPLRLDCRECRICGRFEIYAYGSFHGAKRAEFQNVVPVPDTREICPVGGERYDKVHTHGFGGVRILPSPLGPRPAPSAPPPRP